MAGINRALSEHRVLAKAHEDSSKPCIFLSHISVDKKVAVAIGDYITKYGDIDIYFDINDADLQVAVLLDKAAEITAFIERGLSKSSHIMCLVSASTVQSWWVPYELGFAKRAYKHLSTLKLKGEVELPPFLQISEIIPGTDSLNKYLTGVRRGLHKLVTTGELAESLIKSSASPHPLDEYLDWNR